MTAGTLINTANCAPAETLDQLMISQRPKQFYH